MRMQLILTFVMAVAVLIPGFAGATSLSGKRSVPDQSSNPPPQPPPLTKREVVKQYVGSCSKKPTKGVKKEVNCDKLRKDAVEIVKDSLHTLGSSTKRAYLPTILKIFKSDEVVLRIAAADAIGMIGPQDSDVDALALLVNDPVPDVRMAVGHAIGRGKGSELSRLGGRLMALYPGATPDPLPDPRKLPLPVLPQSTYLYYASDPIAGRVSYVTKDLNEATTFYKGKAKKGPFRHDEFQEKYRYQLADEVRAEHKDVDAESAKQKENVKLDPANMQVMLGKMQQMNAVISKQMSVVLNDQYQPHMFEKPTVYVLEERQIGSRTYPTRYVVLYQDVALKRPGYRLSWMTLSDDAIKTAQAETLKDEQREEALDSLTKKKDATEKKQFKKGQEDLEKALGF